MSSVLAAIPARGGLQGVPGKNLAPWAEFRSWSGPYSSAWLRGSSSAHPALRTTAASPMRPARRVPRRTTAPPMPNPEQRATDGPSPRSRLLPWKEPLVTNPLPSPRMPGSRSADPGQSACITRETDINHNSASEEAPQPEETFPQIDVAPEGGCVAAEKVHDWEPGRTKKLRHAPEQLAETVLL